MKHSIIHVSTERPKTVYAVILALVLITGALISRIQIDTDPENMLPATQSDRQFHNEVEKRFTYHDAIVVGVVNETDPNGIYNVKSLEALHRLSNEILALDGVIAPDLASLSAVDNIEQEDVGTIRFEWLMRDAPVTATGSGLPMNHSVRSRMCTPMSIQAPPPACSFRMKPGRIKVPARRSIQERAW